MVALRIRSFHGRSIIVTNERLPNSPGLVRLQYLFAGRFDLARFIRRGLFGWRVCHADCVTEFRCLRLDRRYLPVLIALRFSSSHKFGSFCWLALLGGLLLGGPRLRQSLIIFLLEVQKKT